MSTILNFSPSHSSRPRKTVEALLEECGVRINGGNPWDIHLEELIYRLLSAHLDERVRTWRDAMAYISAALFNRQRRARAFVMGERHYDLGNDLYEGMLDSRMTYSCGYWATGDW
jgi:hypothetical protein